MMDKRTGQFIIRTLNYAFLFVAILLRISIFAQYDIVHDTARASSFFSQGEICLTSAKYDSSIFFYSKAAEIFLHYSLHENFLECQNKIAYDLQLAGLSDSSLTLLKNALNTGIKQLGEKNLTIAGSYNRIGTAYYFKGEFAVALEYFFKAMQLRHELLGDNNTDMALSYNNIGNVYYQKGEYEEAFKYFFKSLQLRLVLIGENNADVAGSYNNIGIVYADKGEYDKALEYYFKSLQIKLGILGDKHPDVALSFNNIGAAYGNKGEYEKALEYYFKSLQLNRDLLGEKHPNVAGSYNNIGAIYDNMGQYDQALEYYFKSLQLKHELWGESHPDVAASYYNIGIVYNEKNEYDRALEYYLKSLHLYIELFGEKHPAVAKLYNNIGIVHSARGDYDKALDFCQKALCSNVKSFDNLDRNTNPDVREYYDFECFINTLRCKAEFLNKFHQNGDNSISPLTASLQCYKLCDTIIIRKRKSMTYKSDKLAIGKIANTVYGGAIKAAISLYRLTNQKEYLEKAFYFSQQNKAAVLFEMLTGQEGLKYSGIPDSLLDKEHALKTGINYYEKKIAEVPDSAEYLSFQNELFRLNKDHDDLISFFEKNYNNYYNLKYASKDFSIKNIQDALDDKTTLIDYFEADSASLLVFSLTKNDLNYAEDSLYRELSGFIADFRDCIKDPSVSIQNYVESANRLYSILFPESLFTGTKPENLIIIPEGSLSTIPFEALLTGMPVKNDYSKLPYLVKKYNVGYSYSAGLYLNQIKKQPQTIGENSVLALAPVFPKNKVSSGKRTRGLTVVKGETVVSPLPATKREVKEICKIFAAHHLKAKHLLYDEASEKRVKSGELNDYRIIHFATHGFIDPESPELSGILLAHDTSGDEDGMLFTGEIYNLTLNCNLVALSACETGLGKIHEGEGMIGLSRALLYAGAKNLLVSLWQVDDISTSRLMVEFYKSFLADDKEPFAKSLNKAKLSIIKDKKYAHPFYWSAFILIGR